MMLKYSGILLIVIFFISWGSLPMSADEMNFELVKENKYQADGTLLEYIVYEHNRDNNEVIRNYYDPLDILKYHEIYTYSNDRLIKTAYYQNADQCKSFQTYEYDKHGNMVKINDYEVCNHQEILLYATVYEYNNKNQTIRINTFVGGKKDAVCTKYYYDKKGNQIEKREYHGLKLMESIISVYDQNNCLVSTQQIPGKNVRDGRSDSKLLYNENLQLIEHTIYSRYSDRYRYEYDASGNKIKLSHYFLRYGMETNQAEEILDYFILFEYRASL